MIGVGIGRIVEIQTKMKMFIVQGSLDDIDKGGGEELAKTLFHVATGIWRGTSE